MGDDDGDGDDVVAEVVVQDDVHALPSCAPDHDHPDVPRDRARHPDHGLHQKNAHYRYPLFCDSHQGRRLYPYLKPLFLLIIVIV